MQEIFTAWRSVDAGPAEQIAPPPLFEVDANSLPAVVRDQLILPMSDGNHGRELFRFDNRGVAVTLGGACTTTPGLDPRLRSTRVALGRPSRFVLDAAAARSSSLLALGTPIAPLSFGGGCQIHFDPALPTLHLSRQTDATGSATWSLPVIPNNPALVGFDLAFQAAVGPTSTAPFGLDLTNGLRVSVGR